jgi:hypothetical protein
LQEIAQTESNLPQTYIVTTIFTRRQGNNDEKSMSEVRRNRTADTMQYTRNSMSKSVPKDTQERVNGEIRTI